MKRKPIDIKSLTAELKGLQKSNHQERRADLSDAKPGNTYADRSDNSKANDTNKKETIEGPSTSELCKIIRNVNAKDHYKVDRVFYVDEDIHDLFIKLKGHTRLKISHLVSSLLEDFIQEHKIAIKEIISRKQNKFLD